MTAPDYDQIIPAPPEPDEAVRIVVGVSGDLLTNEEAAVVTMALLDHHDPLRPAALLALVRCTDWRSDCATAHGPLPVRGLAVVLEALTPDLDDERRGKLWADAIGLADELAGLEYRGPDGLEAEVLWDRHTEYTSRRESIRDELGRAVMALAGSGETVEETEDGAVELPLTVHYGDDETSVHSGDDDEIGRTSVFLIGPSSVTRFTPERAEAVADALRAGARRVRAWRGAVTEETVTLVMQVHNVTAEQAVLMLNAGMVDMEKVRAMLAERQS